LFPLEGNSIQAKQKTDCLGLGWKALFAGLVSYDNWNWPQTYFPRPNNGSFPRQ